MLPRVLLRLGQYASLEVTPYDLDVLDAPMGQICRSQRPEESVSSYTLPGENDRKASARGLPFPSPPLIGCPPPPSQAAAKRSTTFVDSAGVSEAAAALRAMRVREETADTFERYGASPSQNYCTCRS